MELKIVTSSEFLPDLMDVVRAFSPLVTIDENEQKNIVYNLIKKPSKIGAKYKICLR